MERGKSGWRSQVECFRRARESRWDLRRWGRWWVGHIGFYIDHGRDSRFHPILGSHWRVEEGQRHSSANLWQESLRLQHWEATTNDNRETSEKEGLNFLWAFSISPLPRKMFSNVCKIHRITKEIVLQNKVSKTLKENRDWGICMSLYEDIK